MAHFMTPLMMPFNGEKPTTDVGPMALCYNFDHLSMVLFIFG